MPTKHHFINNTTSMLSDTTLKMLYCTGLRFLHFLHDWYSVPCW